MRETASWRERDGGLTCHEPQSTYKHGDVSKVSRRPRLAPAREIRPPPPASMADSNEVRADRTPEVFGGRRLECRVDIVKALDRPRAHLAQRVNGLRKLRVYQRERAEPVQQQRPAPERLV